MAITANRLEYLEMLRAALQHDTLVSFLYTHEERWAVHKEISRLIGIKDSEIIPRIAIPDGISNRRECRFNSARQTEVCDKGVDVWRVVEPVKKFI